MSKAIFKVGYYVREFQVTPSSGYLPREVKKYCGLSKGQAKKAWRVIKPALDANEVSVKIRLDRKAKGHFCIANVKGIGKNAKVRYSSDLD